MYKNKRKVDVETIKVAIKQHRAGLKSGPMLAKELGVTKTVFNFWLRAYRKYGMKWFTEKKENSSYTKELKLAAVKDYLSGSASQIDICLKYKISSNTSLDNWIKLYNEGKELRDYSPKKEICPIKSRKVSTAEKIEIVEFCIRNHLNYKLTSEKFKVPYYNVHDWVNLHKKDGIAGLNDRRWGPRPKQPLSEIDCLKKELDETKRKLEYAQIEIEILKKKEEIELRQILRRPDRK